MVKQKIKPLREPLSRIWFLSRGYKQADTCYTGGQIIWLHPKTNDVLTKYGTKAKLRVKPGLKNYPKFCQYLELPRGYGSMKLARLKYLTFVGPIKKGQAIDHIDGNTFNNDIRNLRAIPRAINDRDGGFMRKLRNNGIHVIMYPREIILKGYARMAEWKEIHTEWQYKCLCGAPLRQVFLGNKKID